MSRLAIPIVHIHNCTVCRWYLPDYLYSWVPIKTYHISPHPLVGVKHYNSQERYNTMVNSFYWTDDFFISFYYNGDLFLLEWSSLSTIMMTLNIFLLEWWPPLTRVNISFYHTDDLYIFLQQWWPLLTRVIISFYHNDLFIFLLQW